MEVKENNYKRIFMASRETKFGYGFLLLGAAMPYLIDKLLGPIAALISAAVILLGGIAFLVAGHFHRDKDALPHRRGLMATIGMFTIIGAASGALIGGLSGAIWNISKKGGTEAALGKKRATKTENQT